MSDPAPTTPAAPTGSEPPTPSSVDWDLLDVVSVLCLDAGIVGVAATLGSYVPETYARMVAAITRPLLLVPAILYLAKQTWRVSRPQLGIIKPDRSSWGFFLRFALFVGGAYLLIGAIGVPVLRALHQNGVIDMSRKIASLASGSRRFLGGPFGAFSFAVLGMLSAPLCEELVFRGIVYPAVRSRMRLFMAIPVSAIIFAVMHLVWHWRLFMPVTQLFGGLVFAWAYERTKCLLFPMIFHAIGNAAILIWHLILLNRADQIAAIFTS